MARYTGPVCKLCRHVNVKLGLKGSRCETPKCAMERQSKGRPPRRRRISDRGVQLIEKQKVRLTYGLLEKQFRRTFEEAERQAGVTGENLLVLLERRLDNAVYRLGFADSRRQARQLVEQGLLTVNGRKRHIPSYFVMEGDIIGWTQAAAKSEYFKQLLSGIQAKQIPSWLTLDRQNMVGRVVSLPIPAEIGAQFDSKAIVEYYSR
jgi:small subunit ribosomal protein S4